MTISTVKMMEAPGCAVVSVSHGFKGKSTRCSDHITASRPMDTGNFLRTDIIFSNSIEGIAVYL